MTDYPGMIIKIIDIWDSDYHYPVTTTGPEGLLPSLRREVRKVAVVSSPVSPGIPMTGAGLRKVDIGLLLKQVKSFVNKYFPIQSR